MWFWSNTLLIRIRPSIILNYVRHISDHNFNFDISQSICYSSCNICRSWSVVLIANNASPKRLFRLRHRFSLRLTDNMPTYNLRRQLILNTSLTLQCILTQTNEQGCFRPLIFSQRHNSLSHAMLRSRSFSFDRGVHWLSLLCEAISRRFYVIAYWPSPAASYWRVPLVSE